MSNAHQTHSDQKNHSWKHTCCNDDRMTAEAAWGKEKEESIIPTDTYYQSFFRQIERMQEQRRFD